MAVSNILLNVTGEITALHSETDDCICCVGARRYSTKEDWDFTEQQKELLSPYVGIDHAIHQELNKLPTGSKVRIVLERINDSE